MKRDNFYLLFRFLIICVIYFLSHSIFQDEFLLDYKIFVPLLLIYLVIIIISIYSAEKKKKLLLITDLVFIITLIIETIWQIRLMIKAPGEAGFAYITIIQYMPMFILFILWLRKDFLLFNCAFPARVLISSLITIVCITFIVINLCCMFNDKTEYLSYLFNILLFLPIFVLFAILLINDFKRKNILNKVLLE